jgi:putative flippase GtrA
MSVSLRRRLHQLVRYGAVSVISSATSLVVLTTLVATGALAAGWANVVATAVGTVPSFELNRRWVWRSGAARSLLAQVGPFCLLSFAGLALSTLAVRATGVWAVDHGLSDGWRAATAAATNLVAFGSLWVVQFVVLDRILFRVPRPAGTADPTPA